MKRQAKNIVKGDRIIYQGDILLVESSHAHARIPRRWVLEFQDEEREGQLLGITLEQSAMIELLRPDEVNNWLKTNEEVANAMQAVLGGQPLEVKNHVSLFVPNTRKIHLRSFLNAVEISNHRKVTFYAEGTSSNSIDVSEDRALRGESLYKWIEPESKQEIILSAQFVKRYGLEVLTEEQLENLQANQERFERMENEEEDRKPQANPDQN